jgi:hypothetical protein
MASAFAVLLAIGGCTRSQLESGESSAYAVIDQIEAASGVRPTEFSETLASDVRTFVKKNIEGQQVCTPTIVQDPGRASFHVQLKDPGTTEAPTVPSSANTITLTRYHVEYRRADGRNAPGVDVPYGFDGAMTLSLVGANASIGEWTIVRVQAKEEAPLKALIGGGGARTISTIAEVTFYGADTAGRAIAVKGYIDVDFSDWADPDCCGGDAP